MIKSNKKTQRNEVKKMETARLIIKTITLIMLIADIYIVIKGIKRR